MDKGLIAAALLLVGACGGASTELPAWFEDDSTAPTWLTDELEHQFDASLVGSMSVDWNNSGIGCSDGITLQVITPGWVILFEASDEIIRVHTEGDLRWIECSVDRPLDGVARP